MVYMAGDNNLSADCIWALTEMKKVNGVEGINIIAQFDPSDGRARTRRYEITKRLQDSSSPDVQSHGAGNGRPQLAAFTDDFAEYNPRTDEVHFSHESPKAHALASMRKKERQARRKNTVGPLASSHPDRDDVLGSSLNDTNTASPVTLYNFLSWGVHFYPARHYMIVLSAHSGGIEPSYLMKDESSGGYMSFRDLQVVFEQLKSDLNYENADGRASTIDVLGFDSCLMSMAEICYELKDHVSIVVGSETYTPSSGWPYLPILQGLSGRITQLKSPSTGEPGADASDKQAGELAIQIVDSYVDFYRDYAEAGVAVALSAMNVNVMPELVPLVKNLTQAMIAELRQEHPELQGETGLDARPFTDALILAHWEAQSYNGEWYVDLVDFCECLQKRVQSTAVLDACREVVNFVDSQLVIKSAFTGPDFQFSRGVSVYFPWSTVAPYLFQFKFARDSGWDQFLAYYTNLTRRKFRIPSGLSDLERAEVEKAEKRGANFLNYRIQSEETPDELVFSPEEFNKMGSDKMGSDKMSSVRMGSDKMGSDKMGSDKMGSDKSGNPIHSMRNPPLVWVDAQAGKQARSKTAGIK